MLQDEDDEGRILINTLKGLPFLPVRDVLDGWRELKPLICQHFGDIGHPFIKYFEDYYLEMSNKSFVIEIWNCSLRHLASIPRTNNLSEAANRQLKDAVNCSKPLIWAFWERMCELQSQTDKRLEDLNQGICPDLPRDAYWDQRDKAIIKLLDNYAAQCPADRPHSKLPWMRSMGYKFSMF